MMSFILTMLKIDFLPRNKNNIFMANFLLFTEEKWSRQPNRPIKEIWQRLSQTGIFTFKL